MGNDAIVGASMIRASVDDLKKAIDQFSASSDRDSNRILVLTWMITFLTLIMAIPLIIDFVRWIHRL
jgi:hypothetical protein